MLVLSYEFADIRFCEILVIFEAILDYGAQTFASLPLVTCSSPHKTSKEEDILHPPGHLLLTLGVDFTIHGLLFKAAIYQFLVCSSHGSNSQAHFLSLQMVSTALHGSSFHPADVDIPDSVGHIIVLPKRKIPR